MKEKRKPPNDKKNKNKKIILSFVAGGIAGAALATFLGSKRNKSDFFNFPEGTVITTPDGTVTTIF